jgi:hypothetical protein
LVNHIFNLNIFKYILIFFFFFRKYGQEIAELILLGVTIECKVYEESATINALVESGEMVYPCSKKVILLMKMVCISLMPSLKVAFAYNKWVWPENL